MSMKKISELLLETTASYQPLSKLNVRFWRQDLNTAELKFIVTRDNFPLSLSNENVQVIIALESGENFISSADFEVSTEVDGVCSFTIPNDFMAVATEVTGQIFVGTLDGDEVIAHRKFTFEVSDDLLSNIPSEEKIRYIKMFNDLKVEVSHTIADLQEDLATMGDYVESVNQATIDGLAALNNLFNAKTVEYNDNHADKLAIIETTVGNYVQDFLDQRTYIDTQYDDFKNQLLQSDVVVESDTDNWQKYRLTDDDNGDGILSIAPLNNDLEAMRALPTGFYYRSGVPISGMGQTSAAGFLTVWVSNNSLVKNISFKPYNSNQEFIMRYYNEWSTWENKFDGLEKTIDAQAKANTAENNAKQYTDDKISAQRATLFSGSVSNVNSNINLTQSMDDFKIIVVAGSYTGGSFSEVIVVGNIGTGHAIQRVNLSNVTGGSPNVYEMELSKENSTRLKIIRDNQYSILGESPTLNANNYTIKTIEGIK